MKMLKAVEKTPGKYPCFGTIKKLGLDHGKVETCHGFRISTIGFE
jgi:hypothetical protein